MQLNPDLKLLLAKYVFEYYPKSLVKILTSSTNFYQEILYVLRKYRYIILEENIEDILNDKNNIYDVISSDNLILYKILNPNVLHIEDYYQILSTEYGNISRNMGNLPYYTFFIDIISFNDIDDDNTYPVKLNLQVLLQFLLKYKCYYDYSKLIAEIIVLKVELNNISKELFKYLLKRHDPFTEEDYDYEIEHILMSERSHDINIARDIINSDIFKYFVLNLVPINKYYVFIKIAINCNVYTLSLQLLQKYTNRNNYLNLLYIIGRTYDRLEEFDEPQHIRDIVQDSLNPSGQILELLEILIDRDTSNKDYTIIINDYTKHASNLIPLLILHDTGSKDYTDAIKTNIKRISQDDLNILKHHDQGSKNY